MLRDINEFRSEIWFSLAHTVAAAGTGAATIETPLLIIVNEFGWLEPGVLDAERWFRGDEGADPTVFRD
jgi:hypothetical protein